MLLGDGVVSPGEISECPETWVETDSTRLTSVMKGDRTCLCPLKSIINHPEVTVIWYYM